MGEKEQLITIYEHLQQLRREGMKMKDIAEKIGWTPSVLSALFATVLPTFCILIEKMEFNKALDEALLNVNNLSRKKLINSLDALYRDIQTCAPGHENIGQKVHPFLDFLKTSTCLSSSVNENLEGMYLSYSCSSSMKALKLEPYYFTDSKEYNCFVVGRKSIHNSIREGIGVIQKQQILYLMFNAFCEPNFSPVSVYLQLPFLENIRFLKGLYTVLDYNKNPIARRIVFTKQSGEYNPEEFAKMDARLIMPNEFSEEEKLIYNYTCGGTDIIKMCTLPSPKLDLRDLQIEKNLLEKEEEFDKETIRF